MSRDEITVKILKRVLPIMSILTLFVFVMLINKKSYALFHKRIETDITIHISTADKMPVSFPAEAEAAKEVYEKAETKECNPIIEDEDGTIYFSGNNTCIDFNYVWYSGKLWRITAINPDGTMKMITQDVITEMYYGSDGTKYNMGMTYQTSFLYQWLNEDFKDTLYNYENIIVQNANWNAPLVDDDTITLKPETLESQTIVRGDVGGLNSYEYYQSYQNVVASGNQKKSKTGYLFNTYDYNETDTSVPWFLINTKIYEAEYNNPNEMCGVEVSQYGDLSISSSSSTNSIGGVRPSIILKSDIDLSGEGTKNNPYIITIDKATGKIGELINTRLSGEYVNVDNMMYRIIDIENNTTKLASINTLKDENGSNMIKPFGTGNTCDYKKSVSSGNENYWGAYLNSSWITTNLNQFITEGTYYLGNFGPNSTYSTTTVNSNYKNTICKEKNTTQTTKECEKTDKVWTGLVGLPRIGEMFGAFYPNNGLQILITPNIILYMIYGTSTVSSYYCSNNYSVRPSIYLKSEVKIAGGSGTEDDPYTVSVS